MANDFAYGRIFMINELKNMRKQFETKNNIDIQYDDEGRALIKLLVKNDDNFLSPYSTKEKGTLSGEVSDFIEHSLMEVHCKEKIHFQIHGDTIDDAEKNEYTAAIRSHYSTCYKETVFEKKRLFVISMIMAFIAVITLSLMIFFEVRGITNAVFVEVIDIIAWVFMWEAVDIFFFRRSELKLKEYRYLRLAESVIEFLPYKEIEE